VTGHYDPLRRALGNILRNAVEAMGGKGHLDLGSREQNGGVLISVADHGPGIPAELQGSLFEPYHTSKPDGTGLGLTLVRQAVETHGGTVRVRETPGGGATFELWLPRSGLSGGGTGARI
jgi:signal transduction histidine kinase